MNVGVVKEIWRYPVKSLAGEEIGSCVLTDAGVPGDRGWAFRDGKRGEIASARKIPGLLQCAARFREEPTPGSSAAIDITLPDGTTLGSDQAEVHQRCTSAIGHDLELCPLRPATDLAHYRRATPGAAVLARLARFAPIRRMLGALLPLVGADAELRADFGRLPDEPLPDLSQFSPELLEFTSPPGTYFDAFPLHLLTTSALAAMSRLNPDADWDVRRFRPNFVVETVPEFDGPIEFDWVERTLAIGEARIGCAMPTVRCSMPTHAQSDLGKDPSVLRTIVRETDQNLGVYADVVAPGRVSVGDPVELL
jgi:uncharacterized protein YcbX